MAARTVIVRFMAPTTPRGQSSLARGYDHDIHRIPGNSRALQVRCVSGGDRADAGLPLSSLGPEPAGRRAHIPGCLHRSFALRTLEDTVRYRSKEFRSLWRS